MGLGFLAQVGNRRALAAMAAAKAEEKKVMGASGRFVAAAIGRRIGQCF